MPTEPLLANSQPAQPVSAARRRLPAPQRRLWRATIRFGMLPIPGRAPKPVSAFCTANARRRARDGWRRRSPIRAVACSFSPLPSVSPPAPCSLRHLIPRQYLDPSAAEPSTIAIRPAIATLLPLPIAIAPVAAGRSVSFPSSLDLPACSPATPACSTCSEPEIMPPVHATLNALLSRSTARPCFHLRHRRRRVCNVLSPLHPSPILHRPSPIPRSPSLSSSSTAQHSTVHPPPSQQKPGPRYRTFTHPRFSLKLHPAPSLRLPPLAAPHLSSAEPHLPPRFATVAAILILPTPAPAFGSRPMAHDDGCCRCARGGGEGAVRRPVRRSANGEMRSAKCERGNCIRG